MKSEIKLTLGLSLAITHKLHKMARNKLKLNFGFFYTPPPPHPQWASTLPILSQKASSLNQTLVILALYSILPGYSPKCITNQCLVKFKKVRVNLAVGLSLLVRRKRVRVKVILLSSYQAKINSIFRRYTPHPIYILLHKPLSL